MLPRGLFAWCRAARLTARGSPARTARDEVGSRNTVKQRFASGATAELAAGPRTDLNSVAHLELLIRTPKARPAPKREGADEHRRAGRPISTNGSSLKECSRLSRPEGDRAGTRGVGCDAMQDQRPSRPGRRLEDHAHATGRAQFNGRTGRVCQRELCRKRLARNGFFRDGGMKAHGITKVNRAARAGGAE